MQDMVETVAKLREAGLSVKEIASEIHKSERTVGRYLKSAGVSKSADRTDISDSDVLELWSQGLTIVEIADRFKASHDTITKRLAKHGIACGRRDGILRHFERTHGDLWPDIKSDLDKGFAAGFLAGKYHMRIESVQRLMKKHGYVPPKRPLPMTADINVKRDELMAQFSGKRLKAALKYLDGIEGYYDAYGSLPTMAVLASFMGAAYTSVAQAVNNYDLGTFVCDTASSSGVVMVVDELNRLGVPFEMNNRNIIRDESTGYPRELDVYVPAWKLGIEINPTGTHSVDEDRNGITDKAYHQKKALLAEKAGIGLLHMYDDDFQDPRKYGVFKAQIEARANGQVRVGARKCRVAHVDRKQSNAFLDKYHFQGAENGSDFRCGLFLDGTLVAVLCMGASRYTADEREIIRYCTHPGYAVSGGFSRLLKYFIRETGACGRIVSYMDLNKRFSCHNVYEKNGFVLEKVTAPDYAWYRKYGLPMLSRYETMKSKLVAQGFDAAKTEVEIMRDRGYFRVFGAGSKRYSYEIPDMTRKEAEAHGEAYDAGRVH